MEKVDVILEQQNEYIQKNKHRIFQKRNGLAMAKWLVMAMGIGVFGIFWGKVVLVQLLYPMGAVYLSFFLGSGALFWFAWAGVAFGSLQVIPMQSWAILAGAAAVQMTLGRSIKKERTLYKALLSGFVMALAGGFYAIGQGGLTFYFARAAVEVALVILLSLLGQKGILFLWQKGERAIPTKEEIYSLCFCFACTLGGLTAFSNPVIQQGILAFFVAYTIGFCAWKEGAGSASAVAMILGCMLYLCGDISMVWFLAFALGGLVGGILGCVGKIPLVLGMVCVPLLFLFYQKDMPMQEASIGWVFGVLLLLCTPKAFLSAHCKVLWQEEEWKNQYIWKKEMMTEEVSKFAEVFQNLAKTFWIDATKPKERDIPAMVNELTDSVCKGCGLATYCWREEIQKTYPMVAKTLDETKFGETFTEKNFPEPFQKTCVRIEEFSKKANRLMEIGRYKSRWDEKLLENRKLMSQQMEAVGQILKDMESDLDQISLFHEDKAKEILESCKMENLQVSHVRVTEDVKRGQRKVQIIFAGCSGVGICRQQILGLVEEAVGCKMMVSAICPCTQEKKGNCLLVFLEKPHYLLSTATAYISATGNITGDAATVLSTDKGVGIMALSDGMGKGAAASKESVEAIEFLEQFMEAGFDSTLAVKLINSALLFGSGGETYATLDICHIDLFTGDGEFLKMGAVASYIYRGERLLSVETHSLPAGILQQVEVIKREMVFKDGDLIFMMTDGITDVFGGENALEIWLKEQLQRKSTVNPKDLSNLILQGARGILETSPSARERMDDMMVLVGRFWKRL